jgi:uncharacterized protein YqhQ
MSQLQRLREATYTDNGNEAKTGRKEGEEKEEAKEEEEEEKKKKMMMIMIMIVIMVVVVIIYDEAISTFLHTM